MFWEKSNIILGVQSKLELYYHRNISEHNIYIQKDCLEGNQS